MVSVMSQNMMSTWFPMRLTCAILDAASLQTSLIPLPDLFPWPPSHKSYAYMFCGLHP